MFSQLLRKKFYSTIFSPHIKLFEKGTCGIIQIDRPKALNAISADMFASLYFTIRDLEDRKSHVIIKGTGKYFSSGGDLKEISNNDFDITAYINGLRSYELIHTYKIPYIALMNGITFGGGSVYSVSAKNYRVATDKTIFSMPETAIAYFNDSGASYFLPRLKNNVGFYMSLAAAKITGSDMIKLGLADYYVESERLEELENALVECKNAEEIKKVLKKFSSEPKEKSELDEVLPRVDKCFDGDTVEKIIDNLHLDGSEWAMRTVNTLNKFSPTSLKVCHRELTLGKNMSLEECLKMEYRMVFHHLRTKSDFFEGVRALLIDKDNKPKFIPRTLQETKEMHIERFFKPMPDYIEELTIENRNILKSKI